MIRRASAFVGVALLAALSVSVRADGATSAPATTRAPSSALTIFTTGRNGRRVQTQVEVVDPVTHSFRYVLTGHAVHLRNGKYDVLAVIEDIGDDATTVVARRVHLGGRTSVSLDAAAAPALRARLSPAPPRGYQQHFEVDLCSSDLPGVLEPTLGPHLYVVPSSVSSIELAYSAIWQPVDPQAAGPRYLASSLFVHGLPRRTTKTFQQFRLAVMSVHARRGPEVGTPRIELYGTGNETPAQSCIDGTRSLNTDQTLPSSFVAHVPGGNYSVSEQNGRNFPYSHSLRLADGTRHQVTLNRSTWGPRGQLPYVWDGHRLYLNTITMLADPVLTSGLDVRTTYRLGKGGRTLLHRTVNSDGPTLDPVLRSAGWYQLDIATKRIHPDPDVLSTASTVQLRFHADPNRPSQVRAYLSSFRPLGLDADNSAAASSTTTVHVGLLRARPNSGVAQLADAVKRVQVWSSTNGGRTWRPVAAARSGAGWNARVHNPKAGYVSLRSVVTDTHGDSSATTVVRAYAVR